MTKPLTCFKAYDIRGRVPDELNDDIAYRIGRAYAQTLGARKVAVGYDIRLSSPGLADALSRGLLDGGSDVADLGVCGTEVVYFATEHLGLDGGVMVTASHNPSDYNGMKLVREHAKPISGDTGLVELRERTEAADFADPVSRGTRQDVDVMADYVEHLLGYVSREHLGSMKIVVNAGNGGAGPVVDRLEPALPFEFIKVHHEPDGRFPNGVPNPMLSANRVATAEAIRREGADLGVAWDGDYDRCFVFDERGEFAEGYYLIGMLAEAFLRKEPGARIVHDPRLTWNTIEVVKRFGGVPVQSKTGHAFIKERMGQEDALYGGEMSGHHYFRDFAYCDSGMIPWLRVTELMCERGQPLSEILAEAQARYPVSGEINRRVEDVDAVLAAVQRRFEGEVISIDRTDGVSMEFAGWRFNLRASNTEPLLRLNVEARGDRALMEQRRDELLDLMGGDEA